MANQDVLKNIGVRIKDGVAEAGKHKKEIITAGIVIGANAIGGTIFVDTVNRVGELERNQAVLGQMTDELIRQDAINTEIFCLQGKGVSNMAAYGVPVLTPQDQIECEADRQAQLDYWRGVLKNAQRNAR